MSNYSTDLTEDLQDQHCCVGEDPDSAGDHDSGGDLLLRPAVEDQQPDEVDSGERGEDGGEHQLGHVQQRPWHSITPGRFVI